MSKFRADMPAFSGGEIGEDLLARDDTAKFKTALRRARNVILAVGGGFYNRPGMEYVGPLYNHNWAGRLIPFQFSVDQGYALEFSPLRMRVIHNGGFVLKRELKILSITNEVNALVETQGPHGYRGGDRVIFSNILGMVEINGLEGFITDVAPNAFRVAIDTRTFGAFTGDAGAGVAGDVLGGVGGYAPAYPPPPPPQTVPTPPPEPPPPAPPPQFQNYATPPDILAGWQYQPGPYL